MALGYPLEPRVSKDIVIASKNLDVLDQALELPLFAGDSLARVT